jgi:NADP-dependent 3-hydroxy acid dehydrogenase YdfG
MSVAKASKMSFLITGAGSGFGRAFRSTEYS